MKRSKGTTQHLRASWPWSCKKDRGWQGGFDAALWRWWMMSKNVGAVVFLSARKRRVGEDLSRLICRRRDASVSEYRGAGLQVIELGFLGGPKEEFGEMGQEPFDGAG